MRAPDAGQITRFALHAFVFVGLTLLTQLGGIAYAVAVLSVAHVANRGVAAASGLGLFLAAYALLHLAAERTAPLHGRVPLPCTTSADADLQIANRLYCLLNRHYVRPELLAVTKALSAHMAEKHGAATVALDANFPFIDGFPLLPHLSHNDGRKLDLAFYYGDASGQYQRGLIPSPIGYWGFEAPKSGSDEPCKGRNDLLTLRWDMAWFQTRLRPARLDRERTAAALRWLSTEGKRQGVGKILLEPHLKQSLGLDSDIIRFQGCRAARHDDHIHFQMAR
ncbi:MAG: hypothetical protein AAGF81_11430 [Pseudomonadota bacterium]